MCKCMDRVEAEIQKQTGDPQAKIAWVVTIDFKTGKTKYLPALTANIRPTKKGGSFGKKIETALIPSNCPWCGKKY